MRSNLLEDDVRTVLSEVLDSEAQSLTVVNPSRETLSELVSVLDEHEDPPAVRLLAENRALKDEMDDFIVASTAADLIEADLLELKILSDVPNHSLLIGSESVVSLIDAGDAVAGLTTDEDAFLDDISSFYDDEWEHADSYSLRTPAMSRVMETLESDIGPETAGDFEGVLASLQTARGDGDGLDEVTISLLVAAKNGELLYDISKWGEDIGLASKATFSRTKTTLEDMGLIDTEKVPIDVGRPRLRLMLGDERLQSADSDELASVAQSILAS
jgi:hypothetical protein